MLQLFCYSHPHSYPQHCAMWKSLFESSKSTGRPLTCWELFWFNACFCASFFTTGDNIASAYPNFNFICYFFCLETKEHYCSCRSSFEFCPCRAVSFCTARALWEAQQRAGRAPGTSKQSQSLGQVSKAGRALCQLLTVHISVVHFIFLYMGVHYRASGRNQSQKHQHFWLWCSFLFPCNLTIPDFSSPSSRFPCFPWITHKLLSARISCSLQEYCFS